MSALPFTPDELAELREHNVVVHEDEQSITLVAPCPTFEHRPAKVAPEFIVKFECPHGHSVSVFCGPCTAVRRAGVWACQGYKTGNSDIDCPGSVVVAVATLHPATREKAAS